MGYREMPLAMGVPGLSPVERLVLLSVAEHSNQKHGWEMFWGQKRLADRIGVSDRAVRAAYKVLEGRGLIERTPRHERKGGEYRRSTDTVRLCVEELRAASVPVGKRVDNSPLVEDSSANPSEVAEDSSGGGGTEFRSVAEESSALNKEDEFGSKQASIPSSATSPAGVDNLPDDCLLMNEDEVEPAEGWFAPDGSFVGAVPMRYDWSSGFGSAA